MSEQPTYGGQAVIEGVMIRGSHHVAVAVRAPDGTIHLHTEELTAPIYTSRWSKLPFLRGLVMLWDAIGLGTRALLWSAQVAMPEETPTARSSPSSWEQVGAWGLVGFSLLMAILLFFIVPLVIVHRLDRFISSDVTSNLIEGLIRLAILVGYIVAIGRMEDVARVFAYHGAEHKTINAYEAGAPLTPEGVQPFGLTHPRCGTGFLLVVAVVSVFVFALLGRPAFLWRVVTRILLVPVVASISYELIRWGARHYHRSLVQALMAPAVALQRLTTREPTPDMLEVAITALQAVLRREHHTEPGRELTSVPKP
ncbi:MAG: DUF1385 domain-containing protein [Ardenticatenia bacterium]|nr:DUF1385 domain-containing protein [Ardenticatenia bacterium]